MTTFLLIILCEKSNVLGGLIIFTDHTDHKVDIRNFKVLLIREVNKRPIELRLNCEVTPDMIDEIQPEAVILAVGSDEIILKADSVVNAMGRRAHDASSLKMRSTCHAGKSAMA